MSLVGTLAAESHRRLADVHHIEECSDTLQTLGTGSLRKALLQGGHGARVAAFEDQEAHPYQAGPMC